MLGDKQAVATVAVKDMEAAKKFYEETLGLTKVDDNPGEVRYKSGSSMVLLWTCK